MATREDKANQFSNKLQSPESVAIMSQLLDVEDKLSEGLEKLGDVDLRDVQYIKGEKGDKGDKGEKGDTGAQGVQGIKGDTGDAGHTPTRKEIEAIVIPLIEKPEKIDTTALVNEVLAQIPDVDLNAVADIVAERVPALAVEVRNSLELLQGAERLNIKAVADDDGKGLDVILKELDEKAGKSTTVYGGGGSREAYQINLNTSTFNNNLDATVTDVQKLAEAVDELAASGGAVADGVTITGAGTVGDPFVAVGDGIGDMLKATYDPANKAEQVLTVGDASDFAPALGTDDNYVTDAEKAALHTHSNKAVLDATTASFTTADETKLDGIAAGAEVNVNADWNAASGDAQILNKPTLGTAAAANTGTSSGNVPVLDGSGKLSSGVIPAVALVDVNTVASEVAQLALTAQEGDVAIRTDLNKTYIHNGGVAGTMADWNEILSPTAAVSSVFSRTGAVTAQTSDYTQDQVTDGTTYKQYSATEKTKLAGIAIGATANSSDATLLARANHTGTQPASTISDFDTEVSNNTDVAANTAARHSHSNKAILDATTASFTTADETKLDGIEAGADVTDTANVTAAGALMDSEVDADIKTLVLPANTTISAFGATLTDDADASAARTTLGLGTIATQAANSVSITGGSITGITDLPIADGGTGASTAADAFNNLKQAATETATGVVEKSTSAENITGTATDKFPDVAGVKEMIDTHAGGGGGGGVTVTDALNNAITTPYLNYSLEWKSVATTSNGTLTQFGGWTRLVASASQGGAYIRLPKLVGYSDTQTWSTIKRIVISGAFSMPSGSGIRGGIGLATSAATLSNQDTSTEQSIRILARTNTGISGITANGSSVTATSLTTANNTTGLWHSFAIDIDLDNAIVKFYIDGSLAATHTTNIPTGSNNPDLWIGVEGTSYDFDVSHCSISAKLA